MKTQQCFFFTSQPLDLPRRYWGVFLEESVESVGSAGFSLESHWHRRCPVPGSPKGLVAAAYGSLDPYPLVI